MLPIFISILAVVLTSIALWFYASKKGFERRVVLLEEAWTDIDIETRRRYNLIPELIEIAKGYASHERDIFKNLLEARLKALAATGMKERAVEEKKLSAALRAFFAVTDNYPQFKTNDQFLAIQREVVSIEDNLSDYVRNYNEDTRALNIRIDSQPSRLTAEIFKFKKKEIFEP